MASCCTPTTETADHGCCPRCTARGRPVARKTVAALLAVTLRQMPPEATYHFCPTATCPVVYFAADHYFVQEEVRVPVYQKHHDPMVPVCYCFGHTRGAVQAAQTSPQAQAILDNVTAGIQAGQCACDLRNPQGRCCLGNVRALLAPLEQEIPTDE